MKPMDIVAIVQDRIHIRIFPMIWTSQPEHQPIVAFNVERSGQLVISFNFSVEEAHKIARFLNANADQASRYKRDAFGEKK